MEKCKKVLLALVSAALVLMLAACGSTSSNPHIPETVVAEQNGVRITLVGLDYKSSIFGPELKFRIENNTTQNLTVQTRNTSVNGYTLTPIMSTEVGAGEKAYGTLTLFQSDLNDCGIQRIEVLRTKFHIFNSDTYQSFFDTDYVTMSFQ